ncbi:energy-coupling factor transporter transmembrane protein EcfT [Nicoliella spurrieriana]|uniref:Energy-coupling factor transporter transmembrane protein EcfT n=1 Tax=Nicoliella spurrieriana TaxID=2925830 RepID=A0A976RRN7_9LACO|nr:energy-coupling factor transporter transmembrane component T [Nicoliella spurrieriana]UQS86376.1 energy-coupling factor transporter transmembrane protein EcfT [Nicoliella spurrieriana]
MNKLLLGRYIPGDSIVHRMDPASKIMLSIFFVLIIFFANNVLTYGLMIGLAFVSVVASKTPLRFFIRGIRPLIWVIIFTVVIQILFDNTGRIIFKYGFLMVTDDGLKTAGFIFLRFLLIIIFSTVLTLTTDPLAIATGIEKLLMPLKRFKFPVYTMSLMISISLRFVPTLMDETETIIKAQSSRGVNFKQGNIIVRAKKMVPILIPLFISSFKHAEGLGRAMEARGYRDGDNRSRYHIYKVTKLDIYTWLIFILVGILVITFRG